MKQRILYVITDLSVGGVPLHLSRLATALSHMGHPIRVVSLAPPSTVSKSLVAQGIDTNSCEARSALNLGALTRLCGHITEFKPDLVHSFLFHANLATRVAVPLCGFSPSRLINEIQTVEIERRWHLAVDRLTHRLCQLMIGNSKSVVDHLHRFAGLPESKLRLVHGGVDIEPYERAASICRSDLGISDEAFVLLWTGRLDPVKSLDTLIDAMSQVSHAMKAHLLIAGDGPLKVSLQRQVQNASLSQAISFLGTRKDIPALLKTCDAFVFPSLTEGLPNSVIEAMAAGCAVVCTNVQGNRDLITDEVTGILVPPANADALANAILRLAKNPGLAAHLGDQAQQTARHHFSFNTCLSKYLEIYQSLGAQST